MPNFYKILAVSYLCVFSTPSAMSKVIGEDQRVAATSQEARAVGLIVCWKTMKMEEADGTFVNKKVKGWQTTGTLVGNNKVVLGSSHSIFNRTTGVEYDVFNECEYRKYENKSLVFRSNFVKAEFGKYGRENTASLDDWAVLTLSKPAPQEAMKVGILKNDALLGNRSSSSQLLVRLIAHHHDKGDLRVPYASRGYINSVFQNGITYNAHTADTSGVASGGALVIKVNNIDTVIGIHKAGLDDIDYNIFVPIDKNILEAIRNAKKFSSD